MDVEGLALMVAKTSLSLVAERAVRGLPDLGRFSTLPVSSNTFNIVYGHMGDVEPLGNGHGGVTSRNLLKDFLAELRHFDVARPNVDGF